jgi:hypothetical protein
MMEILNHLFSALGRLLLWVSTALVLEELTFGGLAGLLLSLPADSRVTRRKKTAAIPPEKRLAVHSKEVQGGVSCSQLNIY